MTNSSIEKKENSLNTATILLFLYLAKATYIVTHMRAHMEVQIKDRTRLKSALLAPWGRLAPLWLAAAPSTHPPAGWGLALPSASHIANTGCILFLKVDVNKFSVFFCRFCLSPRYNTLLSVVRFL